MDGIDLIQGQRVSYKISDDIFGEGKVVGKSKNDSIVVGGEYIIEPDVPINNGVYNYTHFTCFEIYLTKI